MVFGCASISRKGSQYGRGSSIRPSLLPRRVELFSPFRATESPKYSGLGLSFMESIASLASFRCSGLSTSRTIRNPVRSKRYFSSWDISTVSSVIEREVLACSFMAFSSGLGRGKRSSSPCKSIMP